MAESAAHFTTTVSARPSIFEILAQNSLQNTLHPALQKFALFLATNSPHRFNWLTEYYEETFLLLNTILQYHYLKNYGASFAENFYGLARLPLETNKTLTHQDKLLSLLFLVVLPYFKKKLESKLSIYRIENAEGSLKKDWSGNFKKFLLFSHVLFEVGWGSWLMLNYLQYMSNKTDSQLPVLQLLNLKLVYSDGINDVPGFWSALFKGQLSLSEFSLGVVKNAITSSLELAAFFMQFLQAWSAEKSNYNITALPTVPPPEYDNRADGYKGKCPICLQFWKIPTVLPVSGYVFCFPCILRYLRENQKCPVTNLPAKPLDIIRLYDNE